MSSLILGSVTLVIGAFLGYFLRLAEFRREHRFAAYGDAAGTFARAAHAGAALHAMYTQLGDQMFTAPYREEGRDYWLAWGEAIEAFEAAVARVRMIGSTAMRDATEGLEDFIARNIEAVPPLRRTDGTDAWGEAAKVGPAEVDRQAVRASREFADRGHAEITRWRQR